MTPDTTPKNLRGVTRATRLYDAYREIAGNDASIVDMTTDIEHMVAYSNGYVEGMAIEPFSDRQGSARVIVDDTGKGFIAKDANGMPWAMTYREILAGWHLTDLPEWAIEKGAAA